MSAPSVSSRVRSNSSWSICWITLASSLRRTDRLKFGDTRFLMSAGMTRLIAPYLCRNAAIIPLPSEPNTFRVDLRDSGSPIPEEYLERIFEEYTSYAGKHDRSGGGLGLSICRMIVSQHEGRIWAQNTEKGPILLAIIRKRSFLDIARPLPYRRYCEA